MEKETIKKRVDAGAEVAGGAVGGVIGTVIAGPLGAIAACVGTVAVTKAIQGVSNEIIERTLSKREEVKIATALSSSVLTLDCKLKTGAVIRTDSFFEKSSVSERSAGEEVLEAVLYKAQREPEEKKIPYIGNIFANVAIDEKIFPELAHQVIKTAEQLTYRQYCLLKIFSGLYSYDLRNGDYRDRQRFEKELYSLLYECYDLYSRGLIANGGEAMLGMTDVNPAKVRVQGLGADCFNMMQLASIPDEDIVKYVDILK